MSVLQGRDTGYRIGVSIEGYRIQDRCQYCRVGIQDTGLVSVLQGRDTGYKDTR